MESSSAKFIEVAQGLFDSYSTQAGDDLSSERGVSLEDFVAMCEHTQRLPSHEGLLAPEQSALIFQQIALDAETRLNRQAFLWALNAAVACATMTQHDFVVCYQAAQATIFSCFSSPCTSGSSDFWLDEFDEEKPADNHFLLARSKIPKNRSYDRIIPASHLKIRTAQLMPLYCQQSNHAEVQWRSVPDFTQLIGTKVEANRSDLLLSSKEEQAGHTAKPECGALQKFSKPYAAFRDSLKKISF
eukprot:gene11488-34203_t